MGMTMTQKILAAHAGLDSVVPGQLIEANIDLALANDITGPVAIRELKKADMDKVFDRTKVALVMDHFAPNKDIKSAEQCKECRDFARKHDIVNFFDVGRMGVEHALLPEQGIVASGDVIIGADSPHLHLWCAGRVLDGRWLHRLRSGHRYRQGLVPRAFRH